MRLYVPDGLCREIRREGGSRSIIEAALAGVETKLAGINAIVDLPLCGLSPDGPFYKLRFDKNSRRLIFEVRRIELEDGTGCDVLVGLASFRHDSRYRKYLADRRTFGEGFPRPTTQELAAWVRERMAAEDEAERRRHQRPRLERDSPMAMWLHPPQALASQGIEGPVVYETEAWVQRIRSGAIGEFRATFQRLVSQLEEPARRHDPSVAGHPGIRRHSADGRHVLYSIYDLDTRPSRRAVLLLAPFADSPDPHLVNEIIQRYHPYPDPTGTQGSISIGTLSRFARRAYPFYLVFDEDIWARIERESDSEANLALSPEEERILNDVSNWRSDAGGRLPLFINGRAGSGKSTMLYYLFADFCSRHVFGGAPERPLLLTYSETLRSTAHSAVTGILRNHARYIDQPGSTAVSVAEQIQPCFQAFLPFLLNLLPPDRRERFPTEGRVGFARFRRLLETMCNLPTSRRRSAEQAWHVLRSFIKGWKIDGELTPEDYEEIPANDRTVAVTDYRVIFENIWHAWYRPLCEQQNLWDDLDLVREVVGLMAGRQIDDVRYPVVFCDEAQDFTRLELQLIMRLSEWAAWDLGRGWGCICRSRSTGIPSRPCNPPVSDGPRPRPHSARRCCVSSIRTGISA